jgi:hypothetical protein
MRLRKAVLFLYASKNLCASASWRENFFVSRQGAKPQSKPNAFMQILLNICANPSRSAKL